MTGFRLAGHPRASAPAIRFRFNGRDLVGRAGDTLAAALIANGITLIGRSFKYHRPRGVIGTGFAETNALVQLGRGAAAIPNVPATRVPLMEGLEAWSVNCWPSVGFDLAGINDLLSRFLSVGFYYKTFMWPNWERFEPLIRRAAGLGKAPVGADPDRYDARRHACDVLVVGGGVTGIAAARAAAEAGANVVLVQAEATLGGSTLDGQIDGRNADAWHADQADWLRSVPNVRVLTRTTALGYYDHNFVTALEEIDGGGIRQRFWKLRATRIVLAGGGFERPLLFGGNDLPGVMLADSVRHYIAVAGAAPGRRLLFATTEDDAYRAALTAKRAGLDVAGIIDLRDVPGPGAAEAAAAGIAIRVGCDVVRAIGRKAVRTVEIRVRASGKSERIACDCLAMSGGWTPAVQLFTQSGGSLRHDAGVDAFVPDRSVQPERSAGSARGLSDLAACVEDGRAAGDWAASGVDSPRPALPVADRPAFPIPAAGTKAFVDFQTDVTADDLRLATRENYRSVEHVKRYTVWGMGVDQGKVSAANGIATLAALQNVAPGALGTTKFRPPFAPLAFGALAADRGIGPLFHPWKKLPAHDWHVTQGAAFEHHGWLRPSHYPRANETMAEAAQREARAVRAGVGLIDSSSFGKIEIKGPDAGRFLDRMSIASPSTIPIGHIRYNLLTDELGTLLDDGVVARLADDHFLMTASSAHAVRVHRWLEEWHQCEWPLDLAIQDVTAQWAVLSLTGPQARAVLAQAKCKADLSPESLAHNRIATGTLAGETVRIQRVSFTGEATYEIAIAADKGEALAAWLMRCGAAAGLAPFGLEALDLLRLEKGYIHVGNDTDSRTQPADIGWGKGIARKASDFVGKKSLLHPASGRPGRAQLVGLQTVDPAQVLPNGAHIIGGRPHPSQGIVTSSAMSPTLGRSLALALIEDGRSRIGEIVEIWSEGRRWEAQVTAPCAFDPEGSRLHA